ncbi:hypothetical protein GGTG_14159 [Gaeumannomyces tritici R3-111a-1]|uniref:Uncharacterized protein n=1 Tax=Gaeumannomyces tritici (strain R3-111a-1) TaxID=644352 RepID=J3PKU1_GAET3|nr:hypothetical protein GGTG_14159 [Gaeumannomyces tritici R3-111a-1]EJT68263.1 hypothetical protein GGTG_14159 [Gaeumannomyces tritici R3-111a-1]
MESHACLYSGDLFFGFCSGNLEHSDRLFDLDGVGFAKPLWEHREFSEATLMSGHHDKSGRPSMPTMGLELPSTFCQDFDQELFNYLSSESDDPPDDSELNYDDYFDRSTISDIKSPDHEDSHITLKDPLINWDGTEAEMPPGQAPPTPGQALPTPRQSPQSPSMSPLRAISSPRASLDVGPLPEAEVSSGPDGGLGGNQIPPQKVSRPVRSRVASASKITRTGRIRKKEPPSTVLAIFGRRCEDPDRLARLNDPQLKGTATSGVAPRGARGRLLSTYTVRRELKALPHCLALSPFGRGAKNQHQRLQHCLLNTSLIGPVGLAAPPKLPVACPIISFLNENINVFSLKRTG